MSKCFRCLTHRVVDCSYDSSPFQVLCTCSTLVRRSELMAIRPQCVIPVIRISRGVTLPFQARCWRCTTLARTCWVRLFLHGCVHGILVLSIPAVVSYHTINTVYLYNGSWKRVGQVSSIGLIVCSLSQKPRPLRHGYGKPL